jgi:ribonuclease HII
MRERETEEMRIQILRRIECDYRRRGFQRIAGVDETGRGPLAGPVVAAAVIFPESASLSGVDDSKRLSPQKREELYSRILEDALSVGVGEASVQEIDEFDILRATFLAMRRALENLQFTPDLLLIDGDRILPDCPIAQQALVRGDSRCFSIAAASIIAKVHRDRIMRRYHELFPQYHFDRHKGYGTREHLHAIREFGYCEFHRRSFQIKASLDRLEERAGR